MTMAASSRGITVRDASGLWQELCKSGLSPKTKSGRDGYDVALAAELRESLFPGSARSLERELKDAATTTEAFLEAFFRAVQPFSMLLADILAMFEEANAKRSDNDLKIAFQFDKASPALAMALDAFRETTETLRRITRPVLRREWNSNLLWMLLSAAEECLNEFGLKRPDIFGRYDEETAIITGSPADQWCRRNGRRSWLTFPGFSRVSNRELAAVVTQCESLLHAIVDACKEAGPTYDDLSRSFAREWDTADLPEDERMRSAFRHASHDVWGNSFASMVEAAINHVETLPSPKRDRQARRAAEILANVLDQVPVVSGVKETLERSFLDLLNLPIWKRRHEVYAVWVGSRIMRALPDNCRDWHPDGDTLCFPFSGAHLATLESELGDVQFWTEMRTSLGGVTGVFGRKAIQPDFRLVAAPVHRPDATVLVVECKQYKRGVSSWFAGALDDYALGCPGAGVVLVNYGDIANGTLTRVAASRRGRCHLVARMRPDNPDALARFNDIVQAAIPARSNAVMPKPLKEFAFGYLRRIVAKWGYMHKDIDLHLVVTDKTNGAQTCINYGAHGDDMVFPWATLLKDVQAPPGGETISFRRLATAEYDLFVNIYDGQRTHAPGSISVEIEGSEGTAVFKWPEGRPGGCWYVCWFDEAGIIHIVDRVYDELPPHATRVDSDGTLSRVR